VVQKVLKAATIQVGMSKVLLDSAISMRLTPTIEFTPNDGNLYYTHLSALCVGVIFCFGINVPQHLKPFQGLKLLGGEVSIDE
jgi:hypothetical protein